MASVVYVTDAGFTNTALVFVDDGSGNDRLAGDGVWTIAEDAPVGGSGVGSLRIWITATDQDGNTGTNNATFAYTGSGKPLAGEAARLLTSSLAGPPGRAAAGGYQDFRYDLVLQDEPGARTRISLGQARSGSRLAAVAVQRQLGSGLRYRLRHAQLESPGSGPGVRTSSVGFELADRPLLGGLLTGTAAGEWAVSRVGAGPRHRWRSQHYAALSPRPLIAMERRLRVDFLLEGRRTGEVGAPALAASASSRARLELTEGVATWAALFSPLRPATPDLLELGCDLSGDFWRLGSQWTVDLRRGQRANMLVLDSHLTVRPGLAAGDPSGSASLCRASCTTWSGISKVSKPDAGGARPTARRVTCRATEK